MPEPHPSIEENSVPNVHSPLRQAKQASLREGDQATIARREVEFHRPQLPCSCPPLALILSDVQYSDDGHIDLGGLISRRSKTALPFDGKYRLIDFVLSNCVNSGIRKVGAITQYQPRSLNAHLAYGRPWGLDGRKAGLALLHPYQTDPGNGRCGDFNWYTGTADAIYQNQDFILRNRTDQTLILFGSEVFDMDLSVLIAQHRQTEADLTIAVVAVERWIASQHNTLVVDFEGRVHDLLPSESGAAGPVAVMGVLLFSTDALSRQLSEDARQPDSTHDLICDVICRMIRDGDQVMAFQHTGYWNKLQTARDYWQASMDLLCRTSKLNLQDAAWPVRTQLEVRPPTRVSAGARVSHSLICEGCIIDGTVEYSILSPGVYVAPGAVVRNAVIMHNATIEKSARAENAILDKDVVVGSQAQVGSVDRHAAAASLPQLDHITVVSKGAHIPAQEAAESDVSGEGRFFSLNEPAGELEFVGTAPSNMARERK